MTCNYAVHKTRRIGDILLLTIVPKKPRDRVSFKPGQYATIGFRRNGRPTPMRSFSIVSTPESGYLQFGMRVRGDFTQAAARLQVGDPVRVQGSFGDFTLDMDYDRHIVMLASGIGITPFIGMLRYLTEQQIKLPVTLVYSNRTAHNMPFYEELHELAARNPHIQLQFYCGDSSKDRPDVIQGTVTHAHIRELTGRDYAGSTYFICGTKGFSSRMHDALRGNRVHETRILTESFAHASSMKLKWSGLSIRSLTYSVTAAALVIMSGFIMALDLSRAVPRLANAQAASSNGTAQTTTQPSTSTDDSSSNSSGATNNSNNSDNTSTTPTQSYQSQPSTQSYQPPVSSVS